MKWGDLKKFVEENGVEEHHDVECVDVGSMSSSLELYIEKDGTFGLVGSHGSKNHVQKEK